MHSSSLFGDRQDATVVCLIALALVLSFSAAPIAARVDAQSPGLVDKAVEEAILAEDWKKVLVLLETVGPETPSPVLRLIKGHASLAENRNNESLCFFLSVSTEDEFAAWAKWVRDLLGRHPDSAVALYLDGDAAARQQRWDEATRTLSVALQLHPGNPLVLNARALTYIGNAAFDAAREDFKAAEQAQRLFTDAYLSRGSYILQRKTDPSKALEYFDEALKQSPDSILALNGRACARMLLHQWDEAKEDLETASRVPTACPQSVHPILTMNMDSLMTEVNKAVDAALQTIAGVKPGMSIDEQMRVFDSLPRQQQQDFIDARYNARTFNDGLLSNPLSSPNLKMEIAAGLKGSLIGPMPYIEGRLGADLNLRAATQYNIQKQDNFLSQARISRPDLVPQKMSNIEAFLVQHNPFNRMNQPGGVSSREIGTEPADTGVWNVVTVYGLNYKVMEAQKR